jgi:5'-phosphate synthase pdxT subunit
MGRRIGILALQGDFSLHQKMLSGLGVEAIRVRYTAELERCDGLIIPGGESTTLVKLLGESGLLEGIREFALSNPVMGTCAGLILLSTEITGNSMESLGLISVTILRNGYGRQVDSFQDRVRIPVFKDKSEFAGVFIRAPRILKVDPDVEILGFHKDEPVMVRNQMILGMTFHPELTRDTRIHRYFLQNFLRSGGANSR